MSSNSPYPEDWDEPTRIHEDLDAERALLATVCAPGADECPDLPEILRTVNGGSVFIHPGHAALWSAFRTIHDRHEEANLITLKSEMEQQGTLRRIGGIQGISDVLSCEEVGRPLVLAKILHGHWLARQRVRLGHKLATSAPEEHDNILQELRALDEHGSVEPLLRVVDAGEWLDYQPPETQWLVPGLIPLGVPSVLASQGGLGKSWIALQLCICVATGKPFLTYGGGDSAGAIYLGLEDDRSTFHRRVRAVIRWYQESGQWTADDDANLRRNFKTPFINWQAAGASSHLPVLTDPLERTINALFDAGVPAGVLVIDTLARVSEGDENTVQALRPVLNACTRLAETGYTPLVLHHVGKGQDGARQKEKPSLADRMATEWVRGSSAIVDNFRCVLQLAKIREDEAESAGLDAEKARGGGYLVLGATKLNGGIKSDWVFLEQDEAGRWFPPADGPESLARLRGRKALAALHKQDEILADLWRAARWNSTPDMEAISKRHFVESKNPKNALKQAIHKLRTAGLLQKTGYMPTHEGMERIKVTGGMNDEQ